MTSFETALLTGESFFWNYRLLQLSLLRWLRFKTAVEVLAFAATEWCGGIRYIAFADVSETHRFTPVSILLMFLPRRLIFLIFLSAVFITTAMADANVVDEAFLGNEVCAGCHQDQVMAWSGSHHDLAMQEATEHTVLGDFDNAEFTYGGVTSLFFRKGEEFWVRTDNARGELEDFPVRYVFGVFPLQQLLLPIGRGRLQALTIAWDARESQEGGQRWYHLYPDDEIVAGDQLHWTGTYFNWNSRCAECHSTNLRKRYDPSADRYDTRFSQVDVGCEACHGPGKNHVDLAKDARLSDVPHAGFTLSLASTTQWAFKSGDAIARSPSASDNSKQLSVCGRCHSRRAPLGDYQHGMDLLDSHRLSMVEDPLYWSDGQIRDEVFVLGSFMQSKMHRAGVTCSNCHEPHSTDLRLPGDQVCSQCHQPAVFASSEHHHHEDGSTGSSCVACHMPSTTYMGVDPRRDHSLRIPRPDISVMTGSPNACVQCHEDQSNSWALQQTDDWGVNRSNAARHHGRVLNAAWQGDVRSLPSLRALAFSMTTPPILRASAVNAMAGFGAESMINDIQLLSRSTDAFIRLTAVAAGESLPPGQRFSVFGHLVDDPILSVRMAMARTLAGVPQQDLSPDETRALTGLFREFEKINSRHFDMPGVHLDMADYWVRQGELDKAEKALGKALKIDPRHVAGTINLAQILADTGRLSEAGSLLDAAIDSSPNAASLLHSRGLIAVRSGELEQGLEFLGRAAEAEKHGHRFRYVYAVALYDTGQPQEAWNLLETLNRQLPGSLQVLYSLVSYAREMNNSEALLRYQSELRGVQREATRS